MLDSIVLDRWLLLRGGWKRLTKLDPAPSIHREFDSPRFPIGYTEVAGHIIPHASSPIVSHVHSDRHHYYHRRFPVDDSVRLCDPEEKSIITTTMGVNKSYRLPLRVRLVEKVSWIVNGSRRELAKLLKGVTSIGRKRSHGWGMVSANATSDPVRVLSWDVRPDPPLHGCWWYAPHPDGPVLMRPMRCGDHVPNGIIGAKRDYAACSPPYWHPDRFTEVITPC